MAETTSKNTSADVLKVAKDYEKQILDGKVVVPANRQGAKDFK